MSTRRSVRQFELPDMVGLCPSGHGDEFYVPLAQGDSLICPACDRELVVYVRRDPGRVGRRRPTRQRPGRAEVEPKP